MNHNENLQRQRQHNYGHTEPKIKATSADFLNNNLRGWFRTPVGMQLGCLLSSTLFNIFLELIMTEALEEHESMVSMRGRPLTNLRFVDNTDGLAGKEEELARPPDNMQWK
ncbi:endonuclease-reverse transcriptase [Plakobranchus ocellatus]|uniref:Endonuclease-reverse transcriptase n=1 Tax=Plakobranchus ocellatus TaxID=259542 RepID=A0AAV4C5P3_9GAST|nr:endonuclease-reverse transcriptase [Plakobranchus ocellatus]